MNDLRDLRVQISDLRLKDKDQRTKSKVQSPKTQEIYHYVPRSPPCHSNAAQEPWLHCRGRSDARAGHWGQRGTVLCCEWRLAEASTLSTTRATDHDRSKQTELRTRRHPLSEFRRHAARESHVVVDGDFTQHEFHTVRPGRSGTRQRTDDFRGLL